MKEKKKAPATRARTRAAPQHPPSTAPQGYTNQRTHVAQEAVVVVGLMTKVVMMMMLVVVGL